MIKMKPLLSEAKIIYARGFPYGAPLVILRGEGINDSKVKEFLKKNRFLWDTGMNGWSNYLNRDDFKKILLALKKMGYEVVPKSDLDKNYIIDLTEESGLSKTVKKVKSKLQRLKDKRDEKYRREREILRIKDLRGDL